MRICEDCGRTYEDFFMADDFYDGDNCPRCGGELAEAVECQLCGEPCPDGEDFCNDCYHKIKQLEKSAMDGEGDKETVEVSSFALFVLGEDGIRNAIIEALKNVDPVTLHEFAADVIEGVR